MAKRQEFSSLSLGSPLRSEVALLHFPRDMILRVRCRYPWSKLSGRTGEARKRQRFLLIPPTRYLFIFFTFFRQARARARRACAGAEREWLATEGRLTSLLLAWKTRKNNAFSAGYRHSFFLGYDTHTFPLALVQRRQNCHNRTQKRENYFLSCIHPLRKLGSFMSQSCNDGWKMCKKRDARAE